MYSYVLGFFAVAVFPTALAAIGGHLATLAVTDKQAKRRWIGVVWALAIIGVICAGLQQMAIYHSDKEHDQKVDETRNESRQSAIQSSQSIGDLKGRIGSMSDLVRDTMSILKQSTRDPILRKLADLYTAQSAEMATLAQSSQNGTIAPAKSESPTKDPIPTDVPREVSPAALVPSNRDLKKSVDELASLIHKVSRNYSQGAYDLEVGHMSLQRRPNVTPFNVNKENDDYERAKATLKTKRVQDFAPLLARASELTDIMLTRLPPDARTGIRALIERGKSSGDDADVVAVQTLRTIADLLNP